MLHNLKATIKHKTLSIALLAALGGFVAPASAAVVYVLDGTTLIGAKNVNVNGTLYDVSFVDGVFATLYSGSGLTNSFTSLTAAGRATAALRDQVF